MDRLTHLWRIRSTAARHLWRNIWNGGLARLRSVRETLLAPDDAYMLYAAWPGTGAELHSLRAALERNWPSAVVVSVDPGIPVHTIVLNQQLVDGLFCAYRSRERFVRQEFKTTAEVVDLRP